MKKTIKGAAVIFMMTKQKGKNVVSYYFDGRSGTHDVWSLNWKKCQEETKCDRMGCSSKYIRIYGIG